MGLDIDLYDLRTFPPDDWRGDERFDSSRHPEDVAFVIWLNEENVVFQLVGSPDKLNSFRQSMGASTDEELEQILEHAKDRTAQEVCQIYRIYALERPKDFTTARRWVHDYKHPYFGDAWDKKRLLDLLDLMEADHNLWLWESW